MRLIVGALFAVLFAVSANAAPVRVYVMYGQGSYVTSPGMVTLANRIKALGGTVVTRHPWRRYGDVVSGIRRLPADQRIVVIGYSLGANATTWVSNAVPKRTIDLMVAYDPSIWAVVQPAGRNVKRMLLYHNNGPAPWGHARIAGPQVETTETWLPHLGVDLSAKLHAKTLAALRKVLAN